MRIKIIWGAIILVLIVILNSAIFADSLWNNNSRSAFVSNKSTKVGDLVTVLVSVSTQASQSGGTSTQKDAKLGGVFDIWNQVSDAINGNTSRSYNNDISSRDNFKGSGKTSHNSNVQAKITTVITEVKEGGMLVISGKQNVKVNNEIETILVTGLVRPDDITSENTVYSFQIADVDIAVASKGPIGSKQSPGILTRIFNWLF